MRKLFEWLDKHLVKVGVAALLIFIPLYPKFPLINVQHTWVYVRWEDFLVALVVGIWLIQLIRRRLSLKNPITPIVLLYWLVGGASLLFSLVFLRTKMANFFPNVAVFHYLRRIEYMIVFFVAFSTVREIKIIKKYLLVVVLAMVGVCLYGFGQKFLGWPAILTMNEEFAKGLPLYLPPTARISSTFAGHYDLAAWLVLMISLWGSLIFGFKEKIWKIGAFLVGLAAFILLLFTASRISFMAYLLAISLVFLLQKKKWLVVPVVLISLALMNYVTGTSGRFGKTLRVERVVYDVKTGQPIAALEEESEIGKIITEEEEIAGEDLPLGTGYIGLPLGEDPEATQVAVIKKPIITSLKTATKASEIATVSGEFLIRRALVYDISFTTRFQGTWPRALEAFGRNPVLGSGYSSIELATDNSYFRALGETGLLGFLAFFGVFAVFFLLIKQSLVRIKNSFARSFLIGVAAGLVGLLFNAVLIDVFEASKVAFYLWILLGLAVGVINYYRPRGRSLIKEAIEVIRLPVIPYITLTATALLVFYSSFKNYFIGDDFTWLRWAVTAKAGDLSRFFLEAEGFFYRPLAKVYFYLVNPFFGLRPAGYHFTDFLFHFAIVIGVYLLVLRLTKKKVVSFLTALVFLIHPLNAEEVFWVASTSSLFASFFYLWGFLAYSFWRQSSKKWRWLFLASSYLAFILGLVSHELMVTFPLMIIFFDWVFGWLKRSKKQLVGLAVYLPFGALLAIYFWVRNIVAQAHGLSGDYSYSFKNLAFNFGGNLLGYIGELTASFHFLPFYSWIRLFFSSHKLISFGVLIGGVLITWWIFRKVKFSKVALFSMGWFLIPLLPFLGLGNIAERHVYLAKLGFFILLVLGIARLYQIFKNQDLTWGKILVILLFGGLFVFFVWEIEKAKRDWHEAGEITNKTLLALSSNYDEFPSNTSLYFVNLPICYRRAWVFPVGLEDGLWFIYRDDSLLVNRTDNLEETLNLVEGEIDTHVFLFEEGELKEATK